MKSHSMASTPSRTTTISFVSLFFAKARSVSASSSGLSSTSRIVAPIMDLSRVRQGEIEGSSLLGLGVGPDPATVPVNDPLHGCKPDACALELSTRVQALEGAEELVGVLHLEAGAVVANEVRPLGAGVHLAEFDRRPRM